MKELLFDLTPDQYMKGIRLFCLFHTEVYASKDGAFTNVLALIRKYAFYDPNEKTPIEAWGEVQQAIKRTWYRDPLKLADPIAQTVVESIGVNNLRYSDHEETNRAHFMKAYEQIRNRQRTNRVAGFESDNDD